MTRSQYTTAIWIYEKRRDKIRQRYKYNYRRVDPTYGLKSKKITKKIKVWKAAIRRIDKRNSVINILIDKVNDFFDVDIKSKVYNRRHKLARSIYYKVGLEMSIRGAYISEAIGRSKKMAMKGRKSFTKSLKNNKEAREVFYKFKREINS